VSEFRAAPAPAPLRRAIREGREVSRWRPRPLRPARSEKCDPSRRAPIAAGRWAASPCPTLIVSGTRPTLAEPSLEICKGERDQ